MKGEVDREGKVGKGFLFFFFFFQGDQNTKQKKIIVQNHHIVELDAIQCKQAPYTSILIKVGNGRHVDVRAWPRPSF